MNIVDVKGLKLGSDRPKICIPIVAGSKEDILLELEEIKKVDHDLIELRMDHFIDVDDPASVMDLLEALRLEYKGPILFTFRTLLEGGVREFTKEEYFELNKLAIESGNIDILDIELSIGESISKDLIELAHENNIKIIMSSHDFEKTLEKEEIIEKLVSMQKLGGDISKIAQMPKNEKDVLRLLEATLEMKLNYADRPFITMSMGDLGKVSRISGELFGSCLTFGSLNKSSAPGQINTVDLKKILDIMGS